jgi:hypothetical protein
VFGDGNPRAWTNTGDDNLVLFHRLKLTGQ